MTDTIINTKSGQQWVPKTEPAPPVEEFRVKPWGYDNTMKKFGYTTGNLGSLTSNFQVVLVFVLDNRGVGIADQITTMIELPSSILYKIAAMQILDDEYTLNQKMNWFISDTSGRPGWFDNPDWKWHNAPYGNFGMMVFGNNIIRKVGEREIFGHYRGFKATYQCIEIETMPIDKYGVYTHKSHPHLVHVCTAARRSGDQEDVLSKPRGEIYVPVFDVQQYKFKGLAGTQPDRYFIPKDVLIPL